MGIGVQDTSDTGGFNPFGGGGMDASTQQLIGSLLGLGGSFGGAAINNAQQQAILKLFTDANKFGTGNYSDIASQLLPFLQQQQGQLNGQAQQGIGNQQQLLQQGLSQLPGLFQNGKIDPNISQAIQGLIANSSTRGPATQGSRTQMQNDNSGLTDQNKYLQERLLNVGQGQTLPQAQQQDVIKQLLGQGGQTGFTSGLLDRSQDAFSNGGNTGDMNALRKLVGDVYNRGGNTSTTNALQGQGLGLLNSINGTPGQTQTGATAEKAGLGGILAGGQTDATNYLNQRGSELAKQNPLLSLNDAYSFARNQSAQDYQHQGDSARRYAAQHGGALAPEIASGEQNKLMNDTMNQALSAGQNAGQQALTQQQGLNLNQLQQGLGAVGQGQGLATGNLGQYSNLTQGLENSATNRFGVGANTASSGQGLANQQLLDALNMLPTTNAQAIQNNLGLGNLALGGQQQDTSRLLGGANVLNQQNSTQLSGLEGGIPLQQLGAQSLNSGIQNYNSGVNSDQQMNESILQALQGALGLNLGQGSAQAGAYGNLTGQNQNLISMLLGGSQNASSGLGSLAGQNLNYAGQALQGMGHAAQPTNPIGNQLQQSGGGLGKTIGGIAGMALGGPLGGMAGSFLGGLF